MKQFSFSLLVLLFVSIFLFSSCDMLFTDNHNDNTTPDATQEGETYAERVKRMVGEWECMNEYQNDYNSVFSIADDYILTGDQWFGYTPFYYICSQSELITLHEQYGETYAEEKEYAKERINEIKKFDKNDVYLYYTTNYEEKFTPHFEGVLILDTERDILTVKHWNGYIQDTYKRVSSGNDNSGDAPVLSGTYAIKEAINSSFTMTNGNWEYTYGSNTKSGTYTQEGTSLTISFSNQGYTLSATFTISENNDTITLKGVSGDIQQILALAFMIADQSVISTGTVTLTR